jgi:hypothetical protein
MTQAGCPDDMERDSSRAALLAALDAEVDGEPSNLLLLAAVFST